MIIKKCSCGHQFKTADIRPPLIKLPGSFLGGRAKNYSDIVCECGNICRIYIRPSGQTWEVVGGEIIKKARKKG